NFPGVFMGDKKMLEEMAITHAHKKTIGGHYASPDLGLPFHGYVAGGPEDEHEGTRLEDAVARVRQGMKSMIRYGSSWYDVASQVGAITQLGLNSRRFLLVTDDSHAQTISHDGHMDRVLQHAIGQGLDPMTAIQMMTINTAEHFGVSREMGMIAPGRWADVVLVQDLKNFKADMVIAKGQVIAENGKWKVSLPKFSYPSWATNSVHLKKPLKAEDFKLKVESGKLKVKANVIGVIENQAPTRHLTFEVQPENSEIKPDMTRDLAKVALVKRHDGINGIMVGLVSGFGFTEKCAIASTVAHDSHHMIVVGTDEASMAVAGNSLTRCGGGQVVVKDGKVIGRVELKIAGLMSTEKADAVARKAESILQGFRSCGCRLNNPNIQLSFLALVVIPELRISDLGLVDVTRFKFIPVVEG
ncbi:MAG: adenine deaminase, partial [Anaerolineales bacterium]|nr:adenine deaminase [Anaerolineales bacterium]